MEGTWLRRLPAFDVDSRTTSARVLGGGRIRSSDGMAFVGLGFDSSWVVDRRWRLPFLGISFTAAVGPYDARVTSYDGSIAELRPWTAGRTDILFPGFGYRGAYRRFGWATAVRPGLSILSMDAGIAGGADSADVTLKSVSFVLEAEIDACRRLDPELRLCAVIKPRLFERDLVSGVTMGISLEWGR
jgi:hypothetical protein